VPGALVVGFVPGQGQGEIACRQPPDKDTPCRLGRVPTLPAHAEIDEFAPQGSSIAVDRRADGVVSQ
jgi:hypothetical protein